MPPKTKADHRFRIKISGNPDKYVPGEVYTSKRFCMVSEKIWSHNLQNLALLATVGLFPCGTGLRNRERKLIAMSESKRI